MQIWFLSNGSYSLKNCHNPFGKAIQPPPPYGKIPVERWKSLRGASLIQAVLSVFIDTTFLFGMPILEGKGPKASLENLKDKYDADDRYAAA